MLSVRAIFLGLALACAACSASDTPVPTAPAPGVHGAMGGAAPALSADAGSPPTSPAVAAETGCSNGRGIGDRWTEDCNTCRCGDDGQVVCTRKACLPEPAPALDEGTPPQATEQPPNG